MFLNNWLFTVEKTVYLTLEEALNAFEIEWPHRYALHKHSPTPPKYIIEQLHINISKHIEEIEAHNLSLRKPPN